MTLEQLLVSGCLSRIFNLIWAAMIQPSGPPVGPSHSAFQWRQWNWHRPPAQFKILPPALPVTDSESEEGSPGLPVGPGVRAGGGPQGRARTDLRRRVPSPPPAPGLTLPLAQSLPLAVLEH